MDVRCPDDGLFLPRRQRDRHGHLQQVLDRQKHEHGPICQIFKDHGTGASKGVAELCFGELTQFSPYLGGLFANWRRRRPSIPYGFAATGERVLLFDERGNLDGPTRGHVHEPVQLSGRHHIAILGHIASLHFRNCGAGIEDPAGPVSVLTPRNPEHLDIGSPKQRSWLDPSIYFRKYFHGLILPLKMFWAKFLKKHRQKNLFLLLMAH